MAGIASFFLLLTAYLSFGRKIYYAIGLKKTDGLTYPASYALGFCFAGTFMLISGFLGLYHSATAWVLVVLMCLASYKEMGEIFGEMMEMLKTTSFKGAAIFAAAAAAAWGLYLFLAALTPPIYYDTLTYHLGCASQYIARGGIRDLPGNIFSYFPQLATMNYLLCLLLQGDTCVKFLQFFTGAMAVACVYGLTRQYKGRPFIGAMLLFTSPLFILSGTRLGTEVHVVFLSMLALLFVVMKYGDGFTIADNIFMGLILGSAISVKYTAAIIYAFFAAYMVYMLIKKKQGLAGLVAALGIPLLVISPYLIKNLAFIGDPVYPFFSNLFGINPDAAASAAGYVSHVSGFGPGRNIFEFIKSPWTMIVHPSFFGGDAVAGLILVTIMLMLFGLARKVKTVLFFFLFYYIVWYFTGAVLRFLLPAEAACAAIAAVIYSQSRTKAGVLALSMLVLLQTLITVSFVQRYLTPFALLREPATAYSSERVTYYKAASFLNGYDKNKRPALLLGDARTYYFNMPVTAYTVFNKPDIIEGFQSDAGKSFMEKFRSSNAGYLVVNRTELNRLKDSGFAAVYSVYKGPEFKNIMDKFFKKLYIDNNCEIYEYKG